MSTTLPDSFPWPPVWASVILPNVLGYAVSSSLPRYVAFQAPKAGTIDRVGISVGNVTGGSTGHVRSVSFTGDGYPDPGAPPGSGEPPNSSLATNTFQEFTLLNTITPARGERICLEFYGISTTAYAIMAGQRPGVQLYTTASTYGSSGVAMAVRYSDTTWEPLPTTPPFSVAATATVNNTQQPIANVFTLPFDCEIDGYWFSWSTSTAARLQLYGPAGTISGSSVDVPRYLHGTVNDVRYFYLPQSVALSANTTYALALSSLSASNVSMYRAVAPNATIAALYPGDGAWQGAPSPGSAPSNSSSWTPYSPLALHQMGLLIRGLPQGGGGIPIVGRGGIVL